MKWIFSAIAAVFCIAVGAYHSRQLALRKTGIEALIAALTQMDMQMQYARTPLEAILKQAQGALGALFVEMGKCVGQGMSAQAAFEKVKEQEDIACLAALKAQEMQVLSQFAASLGRSDRDTQHANTRLAIERLKPLLQEAGEGALAKGRMYRTLGMLCGAAVVILLM